MKNTIYKSSTLKFVLILGCIFIHVKIQAQSHTLDSLKLELNNPESFKTVEYIISEKNELTYGWACGIVGTPPPLREAFDTLVRRNEKKALQFLTNLPEPEKKIYALEALIYLRIKADQPVGDELNSLKFKLMNHSLAIQTCDGCIYETKTVKEVLLSNTYENILENYKWSERLYNLRNNPDSTKAKPQIIEDYK